MESFSFTRLADKKLTFGRAGRWEKRSSPRETNEHKMLIKYGAK